MPVAPPEAGRQLTELWTFFAVDPVGVPLARRLARVPWVTPNRLTALALLLGVTAAVLLGTGHPRGAGALFLLRYFVDCLDGTVARMQGTCSTRGAFADLGADIIGVTAGYAALGWYVVERGDLAATWAFALLGALGLYNWLLGHRKRLAAEAGLGSGGSAHRWRRSRGPVGRWVAFCDARGVSAVPWAVEMEIATLGLAPLLLPASLLPAALLTALAFYVVADLLNARRVWRVAAHLDAAA
ncbi:CDP-alcohol phosphatidyltransferase family protein [Nocardioides sp. zg-536]|uniref:CDP-alcohol phosphatidyltransferase family protein n=1 Tax=Nocardioides faecalis TaxID=2803858 RepID=A0A938Y3K8_9ACTN|nr:CDP-alcohol phosphatidyltransferase family protein [Nocardioides faecalis]MBM9458639.1 CDP-alcohol phosphatidyltransferase family protein [Nocardioides faecalis]QVI58634.1 CDP-alcohol phosphatidyltransferase family protein [Nocardioides faecalis]